MLLRSLSINKKIFLSLIFVILLLSLLSMSGIYFTLNSTLKRDLQLRGIFMARNLAANIHGSSLLNDRLTIQEKVEEEKKLTADIAYIVVLNNRQIPLAQTFGPGFTSGLPRFDPLKAGQSQRVELFYAKENTHKELIYDIAVPILLAEKTLGSVRLGLRLNPTLAKIYDALGLLAFMALLAIAIAILISGFISRQIAKPHQELAYAAEDFAGGNLEAIPKLKIIANCWKVMKCGKDNCPAYENTSVPCWYVAGTFCRGEMQGVFAKRLGDCKKCKYYKKYFGDELDHLYGAFVYMGHSLADRDAKLKKNINELTLINKLIKDISSKLDLNELLVSVVKKAVQTLGADAGAIAIYDEQKQVINYPYSYNMPQNLAELVLPKGKGLYDQIMQQGTPILLNDYPNHPEAIPAFVTSGIKTLLGVPLSLGERIVGTLEIYGFGLEKRFSSEAIMVIQAIGDEAAIAIDNARLYEAAKNTATMLELRIEERTEELRAIHEQLLHSEKLNALGKLAASIAHEFKNPLFGIKMVLEEIHEKKDLKETEREYVSIAIKECDRISRMILDLQDFYRPTKGIRTPVDINQTLEEILRFCRKKLRISKVKVVKDFAYDMPKVYVVDDQIKQAFLNVISNAEEAMLPAGGCLAIKTKALDTKIQVLFEDNGRGISTDEIGKVFEPFFTTKGEGSGTGLGLSVSYGIIKWHKGNILVKSTPNTGSTFTIELPINA